MPQQNREPTSYVVQVTENLFRAVNENPKDPDSKTTYEEVEGAWIDWPNQPYHENKAAARAWVKRNAMQFKDRTCRVAVTTQSFKVKEKTVTELILE